MAALRTWYQSAPETRPLTAPLGLINLSFAARPPPLCRSFRRIEDGVIRARISTAAFVQPNDALKYTNAPGSGPGGPSAAPVPQLGGLLSVSTEPAVLYSHTVMLRKAQDPVAV